jgi:hypothetical protein
VLFVSFFRWPKDLYREPPLISTRTLFFEFHFFLACLNNCLDKLLIIYILHYIFKIKKIKKLSGFFWFFLSFTNFEAVIFFA